MLHIYKCLLCKETIAEEVQRGHVLPTQAICRPCCSYLLKEKLGEEFKRAISSRRAFVIGLLTIGIN